MSSQMEERGTRRQDQDLSAAVPARAAAEQALYFTKLQFAEFLGFQVNLSNLVVETVQLVGGIPWFIGILMGTTVHSLESQWVLQAQIVVTSWVLRVVFTEIWSQKLQQRASTMGRTMNTETDIVCPVCGAAMTMRNSFRGKF